MGQHQGQGLSAAQGWIALARQRPCMKLVLEGIYIWDTRSEQSGGLKIHQVMGAAGRSVAVVDAVRHQLDSPLEQAARRPREKAAEKPL